MFRKFLMLAIAGTLTFGAGAAVASQDPLTEVDFSKFRLSFGEMYRLANPNLLPQRVFYDKPSAGPSAAWFDAVKQGDLDRVKAMVEQGQDLEAKDEAALGQTALGWAAFIGYADMVRYLVEQGADLRATDSSDVYHTVKSAVLGGDVEVIEYLHGQLGDEVDWDAREGDGETLAMVGGLLGRHEFLEWVLQFDPDLNAVSQKDASALSGACERGFYNVAQLLIQKGAINHKTGKSSCQ